MSSPSSLLKNNDGYASDASTAYDPDDTDGDSLSGSELDEVEAIARTVRPQFVSDESIHTHTVNVPRQRRTSASTTTTGKQQQQQQQHKTKQVSQKQQQNINNVVVDYRTMQQQRAKEEFKRATDGAPSPTNKASSKSSSSTSNTMMMMTGEKIPEEAKRAFARDKNPKPISINLGDLSAQVEAAKNKKRQEDDEERKRIAASRKNTVAETLALRNQHYQENERRSELEEATKKEKLQQEKEAAKTMLPSSLAKELFIHSNNNNKDDHASDQHIPSNGTVVGTEARQEVEPNQEKEEVEYNGEEATNDTQLEVVTDDDQENLDERQEFYQFLDAINKNKKTDSDRRTFSQPFADESSTAAAQVSATDMEAREEAMRKENERNSKMYATLAKIGSARTSGVSVAQQLMNDNIINLNNSNNEEDYNENDETSSSKSGRSNNNKNNTSSHSKSVGTSSLSAAEEDAIRNNTDREVSYRRAKAFLEGMLLQESFIDSVNALLDRAVPAFRYTKYTRASGEFTMEQHRQWELFCQEIEKMVLKKLHTIMDVTEFFERVFEEDDDEDDNVNENKNDEEKESSGSSLSHDAWELILSVMKFEAFCSLIDSYIESINDLAGDESSSSDAQQQSPSSSAPKEEQKEQQKPRDAGKPRPKATLFHALPRSSGNSSNNNSTRSSGKQSGLSSTSLGMNKKNVVGDGVGGEQPSSIMQQQKLRAPRSAGSSSSTPSALGGRTTTTNTTTTTTRTVLGSRTSNK